MHAKMLCPAARLARTHSDCFSSAVLLTQIDLHCISFDFGLEVKENRSSVMLLGEQSVCGDSQHSQKLPQPADLACPCLQTAQTIQQF